MPVTDAFLANCREDIEDLPELTTFRTAQASLGLGSRAERGQAWANCYDDNRSHDRSPAFRLRKAIRSVVQGRAGSAGTLSQADRESAYQTMVAEFAPDYPQPSPTPRESEQLQQALLEDMLS